MRSFNFDGTTMMPRLRCYSLLLVISTKNFISFDYRLCQ
ncbi:hypothetical protein AVDCRST_MAG94-2076 [uncultured Leptolyngbya sp.]|uniref:Uncharacterized protein n=1 Tax=uncultured Leptolyngbya sp. TaxID=332963 RepID=A0A6J4LJX0_9CYAN|nr:hypothetical protein AVDCRST_MAG94-2076 [uncultured Leptolyngbya sp.]